MSAWFVSKLDIDLIVQGAIQMQLRCFLPPWNEPQTITTENADAFGRMLWEENARSVRTRYPSDTKANRDNDELACTYVFTPRQPTTADPKFPPHPVHGLALLKLVQCLAYQSNEAHDYQTTNAAFALNALMGRLIGHLRGGMGHGSAWDRAPWGASDSRLAEIFTDPNDWTDAA